MKLNKIKNLHLIFISVVGILFLIYAFALAFKRYDNFEYGKFDLGNMSQMVWNTSQGRFMEVTDQFGKNMPRWGMSHVDPILVVFAPIYWINDHPMILVFVQHLVIISAIFPIFFLCVNKFKSKWVATFVVLTYLSYPALGFTLVWTGYHGISFVAPLIIWLVWLIEREKLNLFIYWVLIIVMLLGKEEVGAILALYAIFIYFKKGPLFKKLAVQTFIISFAWFIFSFFVVIPAYSDLRKQSIDEFTEMTAVSDVNTVDAAQENFFLHRYDYLGSTYPEMIKNAITKPGLIFEVVFSKDKLIALNNLFGPLGYIFLIVPIWIISLPDLAIVLLSKDEIFDISNHRIAFVISAVFISYIYFLSRYKIFDKKILRFSYRSVFTFLILLLSLYFSSYTKNPIYISGLSLIENKIVHLSKASTEISDDDKYEIGFVRKAQVPRNDTECLNNMVGLIEQYDPNIYSGPDYLGAHSSNRYVNALFPSRFWDSDLVIADIFETKTLGPLESSGWTFNKEALRKIYDLGDYKHVYSCGKISAFSKGSRVDFSEFLDYSPESYYELKTDRITLNLAIESVPDTIDRAAPDSVVVLISREEGNFLDKSTFWTFENKSDKSIKFSFIDYLSNGSREGIDRAQVSQYVRESYTPILSDLPKGEYHIFFGVGDLLRGAEVYIGQSNVL